jgi:diaminopropionate ammonia-lyase
MQYFHNPNASPSEIYTAAHNNIISQAGIDAAKKQIKTWPGYCPTPLIRLDKLSTDIGINNILYKDESGRFGLSSFKALGGAYAVVRLLEQKICEHEKMDTISTEALKDKEHRKLLSDITVCSATDGNHGRSVAWGAKRFDCQCVIYIHAEVSEGREKALQALGAKVIRIDGNYDDSVHGCAQDAGNNSWFVVSDTSYPGYRQVPKNVMAGYTVMADEVIDQLDGVIPTHVFVQGGVGGLAAAICATYWLTWGEQRPRLVVVEPDLAPCLFRSTENGQATGIAIEQETIMAGLSCGEVSELAWEILSHRADDFLTIPDDFVAPAMRKLAWREFCDQSIEAGESAVAGLTALVAARSNTELSNKLALNETSRVLVFGTEGATDRAICNSIVFS